MRTAPLWAALLCAASAAALRLSPEEACAASSRDARIKLSETQFVACYKGAVWDVLNCPSGLRFNQRTQTCTPA